MPNKRPRCNSTEASTARSAETAGTRPIKRRYERHLPHHIPEKYLIFLTWNLKGAMPHKVWQMIQRERKRLELQPKRADEKPQDRKIRESKLIFAMADKALDSATLILDSADFRARGQNFNSGHGS